MVQGFSDTGMVDLHDTRNLSLEYLLVLDIKEGFQRQVVCGSLESTCFGLPIAYAY